MSPSSGVLSTPAALAALRLEHAELGRGDFVGGALSATGVILATRADGATGFADLLLAPDAASAAAALAASVSASTHAVNACKLQLVFRGAAPPHSAGSLVRVRGLVGRTPRGQLSLYVDMVEGDAAAQLLGPPGVCAGSEAGGPAGSSVSALAQPERFHLVPQTVRWGRPLSRLGVGAYNRLQWAGDGPFPSPPASGGARGCWLLPATDGAALAIASSQTELTAAGWRLLTCSPGTVHSLTDKLAFYALARSAHAAQWLPRHYASIEEAPFPCVLKAATGTYGRGVFIVASQAEAWRRIGRNGRIGQHWLLQELIPGCTEYSASLLVEDGAVRQAVVVAYVYESDGGAHVWPRVVEDKSSRRSWAGLPSAHGRVFEQLLGGFSGVCNFNYKLRPRGGAPAGGGDGGGSGGGGDVRPGTETRLGVTAARCDAEEDPAAEGGGARACGDLAIFECNPRVGSDLAVHANQRLARRFFLALDDIEPRPQPVPQPQPVLPTPPLSTPSALAPEPASHVSSAPYGGTCEELWRGSGCEVVYLSSEVSEAPRYQAVHQAPDWLRDEVSRLHGACGGVGSRQQPGVAGVGCGQSGGRDGGREAGALHQAAWEEAFLLRGAGSPALQIHPPPAEGRPIPEGREPAPGEDLCAGLAGLAIQGGDSEARPVAIVCAGGGYAHLNPREAWPIARWLSQTLGMVAIVLRYRLSWPQARDDLDAAVRWVGSDYARQHHRIDPTRLLIIGFSAGAHLAAHGVEGVGGCDGAGRDGGGGGGGGGGFTSSAERSLGGERGGGGPRHPVRALMLVYPPLWDAEGDVPTAGPVLALAAAGVLPPSVYLVGSTNDRVCSVGEHVDPLAHQLSQAGVRVCYHRAKLGAHGFGLKHKWAVRAAAWIRTEMRLAPAPEEAYAGVGPPGVTAGASLNPIQD